LQLPHSARIAAADATAAYDEPTDVTATDVTAADESTDDATVMKSLYRR